MTTADELLKEINTEFGDADRLSNKGNVTADELLLEINKREGRNFVPIGQDFVPIGALPGDYLSGQMPQQTQGAQQTQQQPQERLTTGDYAKGAMEALGTIVSGGTTGVIGYTGHLLRQIATEVQQGNYGTQEAAQRIARAAMQGMEMGTYAPRTRAGQEIVQDVGELAAPLSALPPAAAGLGGPLQASTRALSPIAGAGVRAAVTADFDSLSRNALQSLRPFLNQSSNDHGSLSVGAAQVPEAMQRIYRAQELDVPINLSLGQATRRQPLLQFEERQAAIGDRGAPIRELWDEQRLKLQQNFDAMIDRSEAVNFSLLEAGESVFKALGEKIKRDKENIRQLYRKADRTGGMSEKVDFDQFADWLNANRSRRRSDGILNSVQKQLEAMELADGDFSNNNLSIKGMNLKQAEQLRKYINQETNWADPREVFVAGEMKKVIDYLTEGLGNDDYKAARNARIQLRKDFEDFDLLNKIVSTKKNSTERALAVEKLIDSKILSKSASAQSVRQLKSVLNNAGDEGQQAWKDIRAASAGYLKGKMLQSNTDERGVEYISAHGIKKAINDLDQSGKLDIIFGFEDANKLRTISEVAQEVTTRPMNVQNFSGTAIMMAGLIDAAVMYNTGLPMPVVSLLRYIGNTAQDKRLKRQIEDHLNPVRTLEEQQ